MKMNYPQLLVNLEKKLIANMCQILINSNNIIYNIKIVKLNCILDMQINNNMMIKYLKIVLKLVNVNGYQ